jgi:phosphatidylglycerophosphate synthase
MTVPPSAGVESTYKARDVESALDIYFYRPIGYALARFFATLRFTPSMVSLLGAAIGITAGHLYFYRDLRLNILGMFLHVFTNALDNADGQLARLTNRGSLNGAIMDGFADYLVFASVYLHLSLRYMAEGGSVAIWLLTVAAGMSHAVQSMMIDHYRNAYLQFVLGKRSADANSSEAVQAGVRRGQLAEFLQEDRPAELPELHPPAGDARAEPPEASPRHTQRRAGVARARIPVRLPPAREMVQHAGHESTHVPAFRASPDRPADLVFRCRGDATERAARLRSAAARGDLRLLV